MKVLHWLDRNFELLILAIMLAVMCVLSFANVVMRYGFHHALTWSDEVCCYLLALSAFFCLPCAIRRGVSLKVDTFGYRDFLSSSIRAYHRGTSHWRRFFLSLYVAPFSKSSLFLWCK